MRFFGVGAILGAFLFGLVAQVVEFGLGVTGQVHLLGGVKNRHQIAGCHLRAIWNQLGKGHGAALAPDLGDEDFGGVDGFEDAGDTDFALGARGVGRGGMDNGRGGAGTGGEEKEWNRELTRR